MELLDGESNAESVENKLVKSSTIETEDDDNLIEVKINFKNESSSSSIFNNKASIEDYKTSTKNFLIEEIDSKKDEKGFFFCC